MTKRQAWRYLAKFWDNARRDFKSDYNRNYPIVLLDKNDKNSKFYGLCPCIDYLETLNLISEKTMKLMINELPKQTIWRTYVWNPTMEGAKQRAKFCRKMARK